VGLPGPERQHDAGALVLPSAAYVEREGTFTNFQGACSASARVPPRQARPDWDIAAGSRRALGAAPVARRAAEQVFARSAAPSPPSRLTYRAGDAALR
jgi:predicted molibdopterin-dependent oxidoreductase YjgC